MIECAVTTSEYVASTCMGMLAALLGRETEADEYFAKAVALTVTFGTPYHHAFARIEWASAAAAMIWLNSGCTSGGLRRRAVTDVYGRSDQLM